MPLILCFSIFYVELNFIASLANDSVSLIQEFLGFLPVANVGEATQGIQILTDICAKDALRNGSVPIVLTWRIGIVIWKLISVAIMQNVESYINAKSVLT